MSKKEVVFEVGQIIKNSVGEFTKIIGITNGNTFALSGWGKLKSAQEATVATIFLNIYGMEACEVEITDEVSEVSTTDDTDEKPTKKSLKKLEVEELIALAESLELEIDEADKKGDILEKLFAHYEL